jgi:D-glycero-beta-D-manno-heptose 1-phosphate adenylyltransferase
LNGSEGQHGAMGTVVTREQLNEQLAEARAGGARVVFTNGIFDLLHLGHLRYLRQALVLGDLLVVGVNGDESTRRLKGPKRPLVPEEERAELLAALDCVDYVTIFGEPTAEAIVAHLRPEVYVKGADYAGNDARQRDTIYDSAALREMLATDGADGLAARLPEARIVAEYGGRLALLGYLPGHSTSELIARIVARYGPDTSSQS